MRSAPNSFCLSSKSSLTPVWKIRIASWASANRAFSRPMDEASSVLARVTFSLATASSLLAVCRLAFARVWTASTAAVPTSATSTAAPAAVTSVRLRRAHRCARRARGSRQAETGSSAIQRSRSSASARAWHTASRARSPWPSGRWPPVLCRARNRAGAAVEIHPPARRGACRRRLRSRTAACPSAGSRGWHPGCKRRIAGPAGSDRPRACSGLM